MLKNTRDTKAEKATVIAGSGTYLFIFLLFTIYSTTKFELIRKKKAIKKAAVLICPPSSENTPSALAYSLLILVNLF